MLSSRDTPFTLDGWALVIEDLRRLALLQGGGANDLNAGAIDANQQALNDLATALNEHEVDSDAHAELFAAVDAAIAAATAAAATAFTGFNVTENSFSWASGALATIVLAQTEYDPGSLYNTGTGEFTVGTTGVYLLGFGLNIQFGHDSGTSTLYIQGQFYKNGSVIDSDFYPLSQQSIAGAFAAGYATVGKTSIASLTAGDVITVRGSYTASATGVNFTQAGAGTFCATRLGT
jgi:hypothetical protein